MNEDELRKAMRVMGKRGGKRSLETMKDEDRIERARLAGLASAAARKGNAGGENISVSATRELDISYATKRELARMSDEKIIELVKEDLGHFIDSAKWKVYRPKRKSEKKKGAK